MLPESVKELIWRIKKRRAKTPESQQLRENLKVTSLIEFYIKSERVAHEHAPSDDSLRVFVLKFCC